MDFEIIANHMEKCKWKQNKSTWFTVNDIVETTPDNESTNSNIAVVQLRTILK